MKTRLISLTRAVSILALGLISLCSLGVSAAEVPNELKGADSQKQEKKNSDKSAQKKKNKNVDSKPPIKVHSEGEGIGLNGQSLDGLTLDDAVILKEVRIPGKK